MPAPMAPWISASEALTIWMLRIAMKAPRVEPRTATQVLSGTRSALSIGGSAATEAAWTAAMISALPYVFVGCAKAAARFVRRGALTSPAGQYRAAKRAALTRAGRLPLGEDRGFGVDRRDHRHAGPQHPGELRVVHHDPDRDALNDLGEVAGGVVRRQQRELESTRRRQAVDVALQPDAGETVDLDVDELSRPHVGDLRFLEVGYDIQR